MRDCGVNARLALRLNSVLNVKAIVAAFNQEKALSRGLLRDYEPSFESLVFTVQCAQGVGPQQPRGSSRLVTTGSSSHRSERVHKEAASG